METTISLIDFLSLGVVATGMSLMIQFIKEVMPYASGRAITLAVSVAVAALYYFLADTGFFTALVVILGTASTVYGFLLKDERPDAV